MKKFVAIAGRSGTRVTKPYCWWSMGWAMELLPTRQRLRLFKPSKTLTVWLPQRWFIASTAAWSLGILEDLGLLAAGICGTVLILLRNRRDQGQEKTLEAAVS